MSKRISMAKNKNTKFLAQKQQDYAIIRTYLKQD